MCGSVVTDALRNRFETIRQHEIKRLDKKLRGLSDVDRQSLEAITAEIVHAIVSVPARALAADPPEPTLEALVRLFGLDAAGM
jgi:glutamyl-tRNA reductase